MLRRRHLRRPVHPHVRGEVAEGPPRRQLHVGSPPRAWGSHGRGTLSTSVRRFTPTCVGKSQSPCQHVRAFHGSPPRAWGSPGVAAFQAYGLRFTPTCVGKSFSGRSTHDAPPVHPHVRGEVVWLLWHWTPLPVHPHVRGEVGLGFGSSGNRRGSPPRAWGSPWPGCCTLLSIRFTPTCVGKSMRPYRASA